MNYGGGLPNTIKKTYPAPFIKKNNGQGAAGAMGPLYNNFAKVTGGGTPLPVPAKRNKTPRAVASAGAGRSSGGGSAAASYSAPAQSSNYMNSYISQMQSAMKAAQQAAAEAQSRAEEQMRAAQEAQRRAREEAYQRSAAQQKANYEYGQGELNRATENALQQAYINKMMSERNLAQQLSAQGLNGGASETTTAGMLNNYNNSRNALETERQNQLASLANTYQNNMAQLENQRASGDAADLSQYQTNLANLTANNTNNLVSLMQGYANMAASMPQLRQRFNTTTGQWEYSYE